MNNKHGDPAEYRERTYRKLFLNNNFIYTNIIIRNTDIIIGTDSDLYDIGFHSALKYRTQIESYADSHPAFLTSLTPLCLDHHAPQIVRDMLSAAILTGVGPMAAVAGAIAEYVGRDLGLHSKNVIVENGGDLYLQTQNDLRVAIFAADSPFSQRLALVIKADESPLGVCTSSASVGHSLSLGHADAVCIKAKTAPLADAAATAVGNAIQSKLNMRKALEKGMAIENILGVMIIMGEQIGVMGDMALAEL